MTASFDPTSSSAVRQLLGPEHATECLHLENGTYTGSTKKKLCCYGEEKSYCETAEGLACHCDAPTGANEQSKYPQNSVRKPVPIHAIKTLALPGTTYYQHPHFTGVRNVSQDKKSESGSKAEIQASFLPTAQSLCLPSSAWVVSFAQPTPTLTPSAVCCTQTPCKKTK